MVDSSYASEFGADEFDGAVASAIEVKGLVLSGVLARDTPAMLSAGRALFELGLFVEAGEVYDYVIEMRGEIFEAVCGRAGVYMALMGEADATGEVFKALAAEAAVLFERVLSVGRVGGGVLRDYATLLLLTDRTADADELLQPSAIEESEGEELIDLLYLKGMASLCSGELTRAELYFKRMTDEDPSRWEGVFGACLCAKSAGEFARARGMIRVLRSGDQLLAQIVERVGGPGGVSFRELAAMIAAGVLE
ncbi:MAG: hypothetical protein ACJ74Q_15875 [Pyrinomonadaceae bacterium]